MNKYLIQLDLTFAIVEAIHRAAEEQDVLSNSSTKILETEHLERILPQLLLDF
jgi:hypothetical protein